MPAKPSVLTKLSSYAAALLSGLLLGLCFPPYNLWPLAFVALLPLLWAVSGAESSKAAANLGAVAGLLFYAWSLDWLSRVFSSTVAFAFWCIYSLWVALFAALFFRLWDGALGRAQGWKALGLALLAGAFWVGPEYFRSEIWWLNNAWLALGYAWVPSAALRQSASLLGVYGISAFLLCFNVALFLAWRRRDFLPAASLGLLLAFLGVWGLRRAGQDWSTEGRPLNVALLQDESMDVRKLGRMGRSPEASGADLVLWPEYSMERPAGYDAQTARTLVDVLRGGPELAVIGTFDHPDDLAQKSGRWMNEALVVDRFQMGPSYAKHHPIPVIENNLTANRDPRPVDTRLGRLGLQICYDLDFEDGSRRVAAQGAEVLLVPNMDPLDWGAKQHAQHSAMAPMRALETGLWIGRAASSGESQIIDPAGTVRGSLPTGLSGVLRGELRLQSVRTFYVRLGHWVGPLCLALSLLAMLFWGTLARDRPSS